MSLLVFYLNKFIMKMSGSNYVLIVVFLVSSMYTCNNLYRMNKKLYEQSS